MAGTFDMVGMLVIALLVIVAVYLVMRFLGNPGGNEGDDDGDDVEAAPAKEKPGELSDEEFIDSYTGPILEDAREAMETAMEAVKSGLYFYGRGAWEEASGEFHSAAKSVDEAANRLKEVIGMVEDPGLGPVRQANSRLEECRRIRVLAIRMEEACDAMVEGKPDEAEKLAAIRPELEKSADEWH